MFFYVPKISTLNTSICQGCKRDGLLRDGRERDSKIIFFAGRDWDFRDSGTGKTWDKTGSRDFFLLLKITIKLIVTTNIFFEFFGIVSNFVLVFFRSFSFWIFWYFFEVLVFEFFGIFSKFYFLNFLVFFRSFSFWIFWYFFFNFKLSYKT